jgi:hypothetical protein
VSLRRSYLKPVSDKRREGLPAYEAAKEQAWQRDRGQCQGAKRWAEVACHGKIDPHHIAPQGEYPELRCDVTNILCLCRAHHQHVHNVDPTGARERGLLV